MCPLSWRARREQSMATRLVQQLVRLGLASDRRAAPQLFQVHPAGYHESDHVLNLAYNALAGAVEDPRAAARTRPISICWASTDSRSTTAGDFAAASPALTCKRHEAYDAARAARRGAEQPPEFFAESRGSKPMEPWWKPRPSASKASTSTIKAGGAIIRWVLAGQHGRGAAAGQSGGNRPSQERRGGAVRPVPRGAARGGLPADLARGDTDFLADREFDRWHAQGDAVRVQPGRHRRAARVEADDLPGHGLETTKGGENPGFRPIAGPARAGRRLVRAAASRTSAWSTRKWPSGPIGRRPAARPIGW